METPMKTLYLAAAVLMASTAAHAGSGMSFVIDGQKVHIDAPRNCTSLDCLKITGVNTSKFNLKGFGSKKDDDDVALAPAAPAAVVAAPAAPAPVAITAPVTPSPAAAAPAPAPASQPERLTATTPASLPPAPAPVVAAPAPAAATPIAAPVQFANSPLGVWQTEENKGNVRVETCGANLCGYAVNTGERILINMKSEGSKWTGRIHDPDSGRDYDSTIAMKGSNTLKVQGCAFGGLFCGGQTWKRVS
jgi:uncharacterized protein (DUF2147 family)